MWSAAVAVVVLVTARAVSAQWDQLVSLPSVGCFALLPGILPPPVAVDGPMMPYRCLDKCSNGVALIAPSMSNEWVFECFCVAALQAPAATASCTAPCPGASNPSQAPPCGEISRGTSSTVRILSAYANPGTQVLVEPPPEKVVQVPVPEPVPVPLLPVQPEQPPSVAPGPPVFPVNPGVVAPSPVPVAPPVGTGDLVSGGSASASTGATGSAGGVSGTLNQGVSGVGSPGNSGSSSNGQQGFLPGINAGSSTNSSNNVPSVNGGTKPVGGFAPQGGQQDPTSLSTSSNTPNSSSNATMIASISIFSILIVGFAVVAAQRRRRRRSSRDSESAGSLTPEMNRSHSRSMNVSAADNVFSFYSEPAATLSRTDAPSSPLPVPPASRLSRTSSRSNPEGGNDTVDRPESPVVQVSSARSSASMSGSLVFANEVDPNELKEIISEYEGSFVEEAPMVEGVSDSRGPASPAAAVA
ncbi:hypothetical protein HDU77_009371 [Chytriomyces hyalinus]|nr:hypothetical protein HDU77_009371 [Chytriomyces hyalinus]